MKKETRKLLVSEYTSKTECNLVDPVSGTVFMTLREGEEFTIDNQMRPYKVHRVPKFNGKGTILCCEKFGDTGNVLDRFVVPNHKLGLWALTSGAARNGVFHGYSAPDAPRALALFLGKPYMAKRTRNIPEETFFAKDVCNVFYDEGGKTFAVSDDEIEEYRTFKGETFIYAESTDMNDVAIYTEAGAGHVFRLMVKSQEMSASDLEEFFKGYPQFADMAKPAPLPGARRAETQKKAERNLVKLSRVFCPQGCGGWSIREGWHTSDPSVCPMVFGSGDYGDITLRACRGFEDSPADGLVRVDITADAGAPGEFVLARFILPDNPDAIAETFGYAGLYGQWAQGRVLRMFTALHPEVEYDPETDKDAYATPAFKAELDALFKELGDDFTGTGMPGGADAVYAYAQK